MTQFEFLETFAVQSTGWKIFLKYSILVADGPIKEERKTKKEPSVWMVLWVAEKVGFEPT